MDGIKRLPSVYLALFVSLYALQGVVVAYFFNYNLLYMVSGGVRKADAADVQSLALVPFILKFLCAPLSDRFNLLGFGRRKPYIVVGLAMQSLGLLGLSLVPPADKLAEFTGLALLAVTGLALYDTCCDGMVIDVTPPNDRERVQGMLVASRAAAAMICTLGFGFLLDFTGNGPGRGDPVLWICAALGILPLIQALSIGEPRRGGDVEQFQWRALRVFLRPRSLVLLGFGAFYALVGYGVEINLGPFYHDALHFRERTIGALGSSRYVGRVIGAALLPVFARRLGRSWVLKVAVLALATSTMLQAGVSQPIPAGMAALAFGAANGWTDAVFYVMAMEASDPRMAASTYALFMAATNVSVAGGSIFARLETALAIPSHSGYRPALLLAGAFVLLNWSSIRPLCRLPGQVKARS
jgi:PAT family beta-lactamase induction signal transducer AmpG